METRTLTGKEDFGFVSRIDEEKVCTGMNSVYCQIIDDASVYFKVMPEDVKASVYAAAVEDSPAFPGYPTGRIPALYRAIVAQRRFANLTGKPPTLEQLIRVLSTVDGAAREGARVDDAWSTNTLIRYFTKMPLSPEEQGFIDAQAGGGTYGDKKTAAAAGGGMGMLLVAAAVIGAALLMGKK